VDGHRDVPGAVDNVALERLTLDVLERAALPGDPTAGAVGDRRVVAVTVREADGAVLFLAPRSDGWLQYFCTRARADPSRGGWATYDTDSDRWPWAGDERPDAPAIAGAVTEDDDDTTLLVAPGAAPAGVTTVRAQIGDVGAAFPVAATTGAFIVVLRLATAAIPPDAAQRIGLFIS
jgi:hypothetical protein